MASAGANDVIEMVDTEVTPAGVELAARDVQEFIRTVLNSDVIPYTKGSIEYSVSMKASQTNRIQQWQALKATMGKAEFDRIGYCGDCAKETDVGLYKDIDTKCARHTTE
jgi:hypothetical protein